MPARFSDDELEIVFAAARPLPVGERDAFLQAVAEALGMASEPGAGAVYRVCRDLQRQFLDPPLEQRGHGSGRHPGKYR